MTELKQCPFCGGEATIEKCSQNEGMDGNHSIWIVYCIICGARITVSADNFYGLVPFTKEEAIAIWNKRYIKGGITQPEITDEQAIEHLQSTGWMQNHDREMYESGLRERLADDSGSYDSLIPCEDTISRQQAILQLSHNKCGNEEWDVAVQHDIETITQLSSAQPERPKGHWIDTGSGQECSECGEVQYGYDNFRYYCARCGSDNRGKQDE